MYTLIHDDNSSFNMSPSKFQKIMFWSLAADIILIPLFIVFGKGLFGGPGGWGAMMLMVTAAPVFCVYHLILFGMALQSNSRHHSEPSEYHLSQRTSRVVLVYYLCHLGFQLLMDDGGDQDSMGSVMQHLGLCSKWTTCSYMNTFFMFSTIILAVVLAILICCIESSAAASMTTPERTFEQESWRRREEQLQFFGSV
jgi:uncharacterized membrane protein